MPTLSFEGATQTELVTAVKRWLVSAEQPPQRLTSTESVERLSELVKDGLSVVAAAAPKPVARNEVVKGLAKLGYQATDQTAEAVVSGLNALAELSGDSLVRRVRTAGHAVAYEMENAVARQLLQAFRPLGPK